MNGKRVLRGIGLLLPILLAGPATVFGQATVRGVVLADSLGTPIAGAVVEAPRLHLATTTDRQGLFVLAGVAAGKQRLLARSIGYYPRTLNVLVVRADTLRIVFRLAVAPVTLDPIMVEAQAVEALNPMMAGFADRRRLGAGEFLGPTELADMAHSTLPDALRQFGLTILQSASGRPFAIGRRGGSCALQVFLDGLPMPNRPEPFDLSTVRVENLAGVEYYAGAARVPVLFERAESSCGVLVLWTRLRRP